MGLFEVENIIRIVLVVQVQNLLAFYNLLNKLTLHMPNMKVAIYPPCHEFSTLWLNATF
jgi:hypothetical protein